MNTIPIQAQLIIHNIAIPGNTCLYASLITPYKNGAGPLVKSICTRLAIENAVPFSFADTDVMIIPCTIGNADELKTRYNVVVKQNGYNCFMNGMNKPMQHVIQCKNSSIYAEFLCSYPPRNLETIELARTPPIGPLTAIIVYDTKITRLSSTNNTLRM
jgi:hypothetical protein